MEHLLGLQRVLMDAVETAAEAIEVDLPQRLQRQRVTQRRNPALGSALPMATGTRQRRFQKLRRILANVHILSA